MRRLLALFLLLTIQGAGWAAEDFVLKDTSGREHALSALKGKFVVVNFWATWCPPCLEEIPELIRFHDAHQDKNAVVWGVNFEKVDPVRLARFINEQMISYPVLPMHPARTTPFGPIRGLPTTVLVAPDGTIARTHFGAITHDTLERYIREWCTSSAGKESKAC
ncbi:MAG: TlpA disulfide reductase family protein [Halothiobacillaceae bacterium]